MSVFSRFFINLLISLFILFLFLSFNAQAVVASVSTSSSLAASLPPSLSWIASTPNLITVAPIAGATLTNNLGYSPQISNGSISPAGIATLRADIPVSLSAPSGAVPSSAESGSAVALAGAAAIGVGMISLDTPLGGGHGSLASQLVMPALGFAVAVTGGAGMVLASPALLTAAAAAGIGMAGYQLFQALNAQGLTVDSSGVVVQQSGATTYSAYATNTGSRGLTFSGAQASLLTTFSASCTYQSNYCTWAPATTYGQLGELGLSVHYSGGIIYLGSMYADIGATMIPGPTTPVTTAQLLDALDKAVMAPLVAVDAAKLAAQNGVDFSAAIAAVNAQTASSALALASNFAVLKTVTDTLGNTVKTLERNVLNIPASSPSAPLVVPDLQKQSVTLTNNVPQSVTSTSLAPLIASTPALTTAVAAAAQAQTDLCIAHPDALACSNDANLGDVALQPLPVKDLFISLLPVPVVGLAMCPAPVNLGLGRFFDFTTTCIFAAMLRYLLLAFAWLSAGAIVFRGRPYA